MGQITIRIDDELEKQIDDAEEINPSLIFTGISSKGI